MSQGLAADEGFDRDLDALSEREIELIRSTYRVITRQGGHRLSLQDIADEAGVSKGLILYHFKAKNRLLMMTMRWALHGTAARIRRGLKGVEDPRDIVCALLDGVFIGPKQNRDFHLLYLDMVEHAARDPSFSELSTITQGIVNGLYEEVLCDGIARGAFRVDDVTDTAAAMRAHIEGTFLVWLQQDDWRESHARYKQRCQEGLLRLLGVE